MIGYLFIVRLYCSVLQDKIRRNIAELQSTQDLATPARAHSITRVKSQLLKLPTIFGFKINGKK